MDEPTVGDRPTPDHVHVSWAGPTSSTFAVNWRTDADTMVTRVLYGTDRDAVADAATADPARGVREQRGHTFAYVGDTRLHEVQVCGLAPSTRLYYKVGAPGGWSRVYPLSIGPELGSSAPFRFGVLGDARDNPEVLARIQEHLVAAAADFQLFTGDAVDTGTSQSLWNDFFAARGAAMKVEDAFAQIPFMPANGNHDSLALNYVAQFALPQEVSPGEGGGGEQWYSFDYGNAHVAVLDDQASAAVLASQVAWLDADLAAVDRTRTPWVFVTHHMSTYSCSSHGSNLHLRAMLQPVFDRHRVDIVFAGHDHVYERSRPIHGVTYVVSGGAGAPLYGARTSCDHTAVAASVQHYVLVEIEGATLRYAAYTLDGSLLDSFETTKKL